ncbi:MAG: molybdopterin-dependent oxidoreductase [Paracoccaceae bacterium]|nr:molybdopterin-dependent oxidoreductase [Paracoccaceae bacterium]
MDSGLDPSTVEFVLNGRQVRTRSRPGERLSDTLRERLDARDVKVGCNAGDCGACTVLLDGCPVCACLTPTQQASGTVVETLAGLVAGDPGTHALVETFQDHGAAQCGICTPGMVVSAAALLRQSQRPCEAEVLEALGGVLCRCTGYRAIIDAVVVAGAAVAEGAPGASSGTPASGTAVSGRAGTAVRRVDGLAKLRGEEVFADDVAPTDALVVKLVRSPFRRAGFAFGDLDALVAADPGIVAVLTANDIPGVNRFGVIPGFEDQPVFAEAEARFRGEAVAAVVGEPEAMQDFCPENIPVTWDERPAVASMSDALADRAPALHPDRPGNILCTGYVRTGDAARALAEADVTVEGHFSTSFVEHAYIEPEAGYAVWQDGRMTVHVCTQAPVLDRDCIAAILGLAPGDVRIRPTAVGGGFGSKLDLSVQPYVALAAMKTGRPVRITYSRIESMQSTTKRHPSEIVARIGARADGRITGLDIRGRFNTGAYASWGPTVANRVPVHASGPYRVSDYACEAKAVLTHAPPAGAFRGFGVPQAAAAIETLLDQLAERLDVDPLELRILNALENGDRTVTGQHLPAGVGIRACLEALRPAWTTARSDAWRFNRKAETAMAPCRRGVGIAAGWYGCGNTSLPNPSTIRAGIRASGAVVLHQGAVDIGQGANTVIAQLFVTALGIPLSQLSILGADTDITPDAGKTSASRQTFVSGNAARLAGEALRLEVLKLRNASDSARLEFEPGHIRLVDGHSEHRIDLSALPEGPDGYVLRAEETYDPPVTPLDRDGQGIPYAQFGYAAHVAELEVDMALGRVRPLRITAAHDVGMAINPVLAEGQVHGGIAQGLGMALMEEYLPGRTENLHDYLIPSIGDMPPVETFFIEEADPHGPYGAKGLGEHVLIPTAPAILNAIADACEIRLDSLPASPSRISAAIRARDCGENGSRSHGHA